MNATLAAERLETFMEAFPGVPEAVIEELIDNHEGYTPEEFAYEGEADSFKALASQMVDDGMLGEIPEHLANYIDCDAIGRDLDAGGVYEIRHNWTGYYWSIQ